jgi:crossover junction endodeoxyribonuclease RuvC
MRVVGFDPGLRLTGFGVIETSGRDCRVIQAGVIKAREKQDLSLRLQEIFNGVAQVLEENSPEEVAVEELFTHYEHPRTSILMGHARGLIFLAAAQKCLPVTSYSAKKVKQTLTGNGSATKMQMQRSIQTQLRLACLPEPPDVADALAIALCHLTRAQKRWALK